MAFTLQTFVADPTLVTGGARLPAVAANPSLHTGGAFLPAFAADPADVLTFLDLPLFIPDGATYARSLPVPQFLGPVSFFDAALPRVTGEFIGQPSLALTLPVLSAGFQSTAVSGDLAGAAPLMTFAASDLAVTGNLTASAPKFTAALQNLDISGSVSATLLVPRFSALDSSYIDTFRLSAALPALSASFAAAAAVPAALAASLPALACAVEGGTASFSPALPALRAQLQGHVALAGSVNARLARLSGAFAAQPTVLAAMSAQLPCAIVQVRGLAGTAASLAARLPVLLGAVAGAAGTVGTLQVQLALPAAVFGAASQVSGTLTVALPRLGADMRLSAAVAQIFTHVVNTVTNAVTSYEQYPYNSFAEFAGSYLAAGPGGLYQIDSGDKDTTAAVAARIKSGQTGFGSEFQKRLSDFYVAMRSAGDIVLRVYVDENDPVEYVLSPRDVALLMQRRSPIGKGLRGKYWQFELENVDGCAFDIDTMNVAVTPMSRRI